MKVNRDLIGELRWWKKKCDRCVIDRIITNQYNEVFSTDFDVANFAHKRDESNKGKKSKGSCRIGKTNYGSFTVLYSNGFGDESGFNDEHRSDRNMIELFPSDIKRVIYKH